ncbi:hypothetical protein [Parasitella parasitica]|uniref:F-box domain-containing protein n=1 Tax=Parasitella parasitica TaxID=35722 RepID=A0A0B7NLQ4_9FUNG|nr:hypothetical protein [Parasitella parasitica]
MSQLGVFLDQVHQRLQDNSTANKVIVTGNDSADLDSIISALLFAYLSSEQDEATLYIPLVKVPKADLALRPELAYVMGLIHLDHQKLVCIDELTLDPDAAIVLVDHNHLTSPLSHYGDRVIGVLDHHVDEHFYQSAPLRRVEMVGSCVTLVLDHFPDHLWTNSTEIAQLALGPLLIDTVNLKWELGRTTELDDTVYHKLVGSLYGVQSASTTLLTDDYFKSIEKVKSKVDTMSSYDILRRDYKEFVVDEYRIGTSAVTWHFRAWAERDGAQEIKQAAIDYANRRQLDIEVIFTAFDHDGDYRRQLAVFVIEPKLQRVQDSLERNSDIQLKPIKEFETTGFYDQGNIRMSRKQLSNRLDRTIMTNQITDFGKRDTYRELFERFLCFLLHLKLSFGGKPKKYPLKESGFISRLPQEVLQCIYQQLDIQDIYAFNQTCRSFHRVAMQPSSKAAWMVTQYGARFALYYALLAVPQHCHGDFLHMLFNRGAIVPRHVLQRLIQVYLKPIEKRRRRSSFDIFDLDTFFAQQVQSLSFDGYATILQRGHQLYGNDFDLQANYHDPTSMPLDTMWYFPAPAPVDINLRPLLRLAQTEPAKFALMNPVFAFDPVARASLWETTLLVLFDEAFRTTPPTPDRQAQLASLPLSSQVRLVGHFTDQQLFCQVFANFFTKYPVGYCPSRTMYKILQLLKQYVRPSFNIDVALEHMVHASLGRSDTIDSVDKFLKQK